MTETNTIATTEKITRFPTYYLSHGGGPWPFMSGAFRAIFRVLEQSLADIPQQLPRTPNAVLIISAHWEQETLSVSCAKQQGMLHDYFGFPDELYRVSYPAPGQPEIAEQVATLLESKGWQVKRNSTHALDHGVFSLLKPMYPAANIPVVQLSLRTSLDAREHFAIGQALAPLRDRGVLILASGQSYHNLQARGKNARFFSEMFDRWLRQTLLLKKSDERAEALFSWELAPAALNAHPRSEHFIPLMVATGAAAEEKAHCVFGDYIADFATSGYRFGGDDTSSPFDLLKLHTQDNQVNHRE